MALKPWVLGISASHNGAYCLLHGNEIRVAVQEERLVGLKRARVYGGHRGLGLSYCLAAAGISVSDLSMVVLSCQRSAKAEENDIWMNPDLSGLSDVPRRVVSHHMAHAASAVATSGYENTAVLVVDGLGSPVKDLSEVSRSALIDPDVDGSEHMTLFHARGNRITPVEIHTAEKWLEREPDRMWRFFTLGGMYSAVAQQIFGDPMDAGKVMGLAPYGKPRIPSDEFLDFEGLRIRFPNLVQRRFGHRHRWPMRRRSYEDLAASVQYALETALLRVVARLRGLTRDSHLCLAGGVALNSVANQRIVLEGGFKHVYIMPSAEDSGVAVGAAYLGLWELGGGRPSTQVRTDAHGRTNTSSDIAAALQMVPDIVSRSPADFMDEVTDRLREGQIGGWFQGGSEFGPRALGHRSIICSPCGRSTKKTLNARVKLREEFRPFAPSVLAEHAAGWFDFGASPSQSPFMLRVIPFRKPHRDRVPAVVHVDGTGRVQTLTAEDNGRFYELVAHFFAKTRVPMLLNTSMNIRGEPIAETPIDALWCLLGTGLDFCVLHGWIVTKSATFVSILDYVPIVVAEGYTLKMDVAEFRLQTSIQREDAVTVRTSTPWGSVDQRLPIRLLPLLARVDGRQDGHALVRAQSGGVSPSEVARDLLLLRRMRVIEFLR